MVEIIEKIKGFIADIAPSNMTEEKLNQLKIIFDELRNLESKKRLEEAMTEEDDEISEKEKSKCDLCGGSYTKDNRGHHIKSKKHLTAEAKKYGCFDFTTGEIKKECLNKSQKNDLKLISKSARESLKK